MTDTWLASKDLALLEAYVSGVRATGIVKGREAVLDEAGTVISEAAGDPDKYYVCVRIAFEVPLADGIEVVDPVVGASIVTWL